MTAASFGILDWLSGAEHRRRSRARVRRALRFRRVPRPMAPIWYRLLIWSCRNSAEPAPHADGEPAPADSAELHADRQRIADILIFLLAALLVFTLLKQATDFVADQAQELVWYWTAMAAASTLAFLWVDMRAMPRFAMRAMRASAGFLMLYFAVEPFAIPYAALPADHPAILFHAHARLAGMALALCGLWRPSCLVGAALTLWMTRELQTSITGFYFSTLDIRNVAEVIAFWAIGFTLLGAAWASPRARAALALDGERMFRAALVIFAAGVGAHLANYFWSALAKLALDGGPSSWVLGNRLYDGIPGALEKGTLPLANWPAAVDLLHRTLKLLAIPANIACFAVQITAILAPLRRRWLILSTFAFDIFHGLVWFTLGLLFWKWMALNFIIVAALSVLGEQEWRGLPRATCITFVICGMAIFRTATLAWYETPGFASPYFVAEMQDGRRIRIPSAFFLSSSYQVSQGRLWWPGGLAHFNPSIWGSVLHFADAQAGRACAIPARKAPAPPEWGPPEALGRFVRAAHRQMLPRLDAQGRLAYYRVPHHHVPSPFVPDPFYAVDKRRIAKYVFVMDSVCLSLDHGRLRRRVLAHTELPVYDVARDRIMP